MAKNGKTRKICGLKGEVYKKVGRKTFWRLSYPTKCATLNLNAEKYLGEWHVSYGELKMGTGKTMKEAVSKAKDRMAYWGYELI